MTAPTLMTHDDAILALRGDPASADTVRDNYIGADVSEAATRFLRSAEFAEVISLLGGVLGSTVADIGAGNGIASFAFAHSGASVVYAVEPDDSPVVGRRAMRVILDGLPIVPVAAVGEALPLRDESVDVVYTRATLHHVRELDRFTAEAARVLRRGGKFVACREHVAETEAELRAFLESHPLQRLCGGEYAYPAATYADAIAGAGLRVDSVLGPWDGVINAFPTVRSDEELHDLVGTRLRRKLGPLRGLASLARPMEPALALWTKRPFPGRLYSFVATKP